MFRGCTKLTDLSVFSETKLPATELKPSCYRELFRECSSLTAVPKDLLPATTLAERCYQQMFAGCKAITQVPDLPAGTLVTRCYNSMFSGCSALKSITCLATEGINKNNSTTTWVSNVGHNGTFTKKNGVSWPSSGPNGIPNNWTVVGVD